MFAEFKKFISRGSVLDLAVGVIIGGAFGKIVSSLVNDLLMPLIGLALGGINFSDRFFAMDGGTYENLQAARDANAAVLAYGAFIQNVIDFLIIAFVIFLIVRMVNRFTPKPAVEAPAEPTSKECPYCASAIPLKATRCPNCTSVIS